MAKAKVRVHGISGLVCSFSARLGCTAGEVKGLIETEVGAPSRELRLLLGTTALDDDDVLVPSVSAVDVTLVRIDPARAAALEAVARQGDALQWLPDDLRADREIVLVAVQNRGTAFRFASQELRDDKAVILTALEQDVWAFRHVAEDLRRQRDFVLEAVARSGGALRFAAEELRADREVVLTAVQQCDWSFQFAAEELRDNREVVLAVVRLQGSALRYASDWLRGDRAVVLEAVRRCGSALQFASEELRDERELALAAVRQNSVALIFVGPRLQADRAFLIAAQGARRTSVAGAPSPASSSRPQQPGPDAAQDVPHTAEPRPSSRQAQPAADADNGALRLMSPRRDPDLCAAAGNITIAPPANGSHHSQAVAFDKAVFLFPEAGDGMGGVADMRTSRHGRCQLLATFCCACGRAFARVGVGFAALQSRASACARAARRRVNARRARGQGLSMRLSASSRGLRDGLGDAG